MYAVEESVWFDLVILNCAPTPCGVLFVPLTFNELPVPVFAVPVILPIVVTTPPTKLFTAVIVNSKSSDDIIKGEIIDVVRRVIGPIAKPDKVQIVSGLPKTRSGKIMRRILRKIAQGDTENLGDISTLADPSVVEKLL